jgi:hypothetical protein
MSKPTRLSAKIDQLKILLLNAEEFADAMNYFLDELVSDSAFSAAGKPLKDKRIKQRFRGVLQILKERLNIQSAGPPQMIATVSLKEYQLSHGAFMLGDRLGMATFYFRDLDMGSGLGVPWAPWMAQEKSCLRAFRSMTKLAPRRASTRIDPAVATDARALA